MIDAMVESRPSKTQALHKTRRLAKTAEEVALGVLSGTWRLGVKPPVATFRALI